MAFPDTNILDDFNRPNEGPPPSSKWAIGGFLTATNSLIVVSNRCMGTDPATNGAWWNSIISPNCEVFADITVRPGDGQDISLAARYTATNIDTGSGYLLVYTDERLGNDELTITRMDAGADTPLLSIVQELNDGDSIGMKLDGTTLEIYYKAGAGVWTFLGSVVDATYNASGFLGATISTDVGAIDNFGGGSLEALALNTGQVCRAFPVLTVTDGAERINLLNCGRWSLEDWTPSIPSPKGGGVWQSSPLSDGRQLIDRKWSNWMDVFTLTLAQPSQDIVIQEEQELLRLLVKAHQYWTTQWQSEPVWIEARAAFETNLRYTIIKDWRFPEGSGNPFAQPFILSGQEKSIIEKVSLTVEHGPWLADQPGTGTCVEISGQQTNPPYYLSFDEITSNVNCGSNAALDNLVAGDVTFEAWIRAGAGGEAAYIFNKGSTLISVTVNSEIAAQAAYAVQDGLSVALVNGFLFDSDWHHIAVTWELAAVTFRIWVDGVEVTYAVQDAAIGAYAGDAANDLYIGNWAAGTGAFAGDIGWCRISSNLRYAANFISPARCVLPHIDGNTVAQWIGLENSGATILNQQGAPVLDGIQTDCTFDTDCWWGRDETCGDEVYIANKHNLAQLTHIFVDDGGVFGANLLAAATPFELLPAVPVANDAIYFGILGAAANSGPFCSLVFDIGMAIAGVTGLVWEYWNGAWVALTIQDNTDTDGAMTGVAFDTTGVNSVHWNQPADWVSATVNFLPGYWVRARVTVAPAGTAPTQQNRSIYSIVWADLDIEDERVTGDIPMAINLQISTQSGGLPASTSRPYSSRVVTGLRSLNRGENFTAYLNAADEQNPAGITVRVSGTSAFANDATSPTGRRITDTGTHPAGDFASWSFDNTIANHFYGTYHAFARGQLVAGAAITDVQISLATGTGEGGTATFDQLFRTDYVQFGVVALTWQLLDFGQIQLPSAQISGNDDIAVMGIELQSIISNARTFHIYDLILIPVDENAHEVIDPTLVAAHNVIYSNRIELDSVTFPRSRIYTPMKETATGEYQTPWRHIGPSGMLLQANADQQIWTLAQLYFSGDWFAFPYIAHSVQVEGTARYLYARGNR